MNEIDSLVQNMQTGNDTQRRAASYKLGRKGDPRAVIPLIGAYVDPDMGVQRNVMEGLRNIADKTALDFLGMPEHVKIKVSEHVRQTNAMPSAEEIRTFLEFLPENVAAVQHPEPSREAQECLERAYRMIDQIPQNGQIEDSYKLDIASELALAINLAGAPFPHAHALLAIMMNDLKDDKRALQHAQQALQYDPNEFRAQLVKLDVMVKDVKILNLKPGHFIELNGSLENIAYGTIGKSIGALLAAGNAGLSQSNFVMEVQKLATIFINLCKVTHSVDEYVFMANTLIGLGDLLANTSIITGRPDLYSIVADTPTGNLDHEGQNEDVINIKRKARGRFFLYRQ